jgi:GT2 family glycosyltransferase
MNDGMTAARGDVAVCLNNDVAVPSDFLPPLLTHFADRQCFAVSPSMRREGGDESYIRGRFRRGFLEIHRPPSQAASSARPVLYACGGAVAYAREKFLALGGFDPLFSPFNGEDLDLSYRGWKRGWRVLWEPASVVTHVGRATIGRFYPTPFIRHTQVRARIIFAWKNVLDPVWTAEHWALLPLRTALRAARGERWFVTALRSCLRDLPAIRAARSRERREARVSDRDVFRIVAPP